MHKDLLIDQRDSLKISDRLGIHRESDCDHATLPVKGRNYTRDML